MAAAAPYVAAGGAELMAAPVMGGGAPAEGSAFTEDTRDEAEDVVEDFVRGGQNKTPNNKKVKSSQVNTLPKAKSKTRSKQNKDMHKCSSVHSERGVPLPVLTSGGE